MPTAGPARLKLRHVVLMITFLAWVVVPFIGAAYYLFSIANDQYASRVGFAVRTADTGSAIELLGGISELSSANSSDTDILYEFIQSPQIVRAVDERLGLAGIYRRDNDPVFALGEDTRIEALSAYWRRMVKVFYDRSSGLIEVRVLAFDAASAHAIAVAIFEESNGMINELSAIAQADTLRYSEQELARAQDRMKQARQALTSFRNQSRIVDPTADIQSQMGLITSLQAQLAEAIIERDLLLENASTNDPRLAQIERRIEVIRDRIERERDQFVESGERKDDAFSRLLEEYEALSVDLEFAERAAISARTAYDLALSEAQRKSRYLASYIPPTLAETPEYPRRIVLLAILGAGLAISWAIGALIYYSLRDRR
ncbi:capsular polysaccharide transport system permease protein [Rhodovulum bhavnagarense]|uniref:Capsular polysaccharide transport system permease protein n=1 Tax=Rhodovulum bhavnagarense TaxID=992286 RepID=A0A4R2RMG0_9RHOB|nr:sugar transporter [Rhodovulum bhavnagarense]TCP60385.1 capsular polysaccharide transport system permease protein [Rhodovulum bhavnagarense]